MHKSNFVTAIKVGGKVLREFDNSVYIPFGSEYTILLKNLSSVRARVSVSIDGDDALGDYCLIIDGKDEIELKRFVKNGNLQKGNAFKFIEKTAKIEKHRGNRANDGLITVTYEFESEWWKQPYAISGSMGKARSGGYRGIGPDWNEAQTFYSTTMQDGHLGVACNDEDILRSVPSITSNYVSQVGSPLRASAQAAANVKSFLPQNDAGVTAPGQVTDQSFHLSTRTFWSDGIKHDMTIQLRGDVGQEKAVVKAPVTVKKLKRCSMCGTNVKQTAKFCHECGSSVEIV